MQTDRKCLTTRTKNSSVHRGHVTQRRWYEWSNEDLYFFNTLRRGLDARVNVGNRSKKRRRATNYRTRSCLFAERTNPWFWRSLVYVAREIRKIFSRLSRLAGLISATTKIPSSPEREQTSGIVIRWKRGFSACLLFLVSFSSFFFLFFFFFYFLSFLLSFFGSGHTERVCVTRVTSNTSKRRTGRVAGCVTRLPEIVQHTKPTRRNGNSCHGRRCAIVTLEVVTRERNSHGVGSKLLVQHIPAIPAGRYRVSGAPLFLREHPCKRKNTGDWK